jgi:hypothetical protein
MALADWRRVIGEAAEFGRCRIQSIEGEPTLHPRLAVVMGQALNSRIRGRGLANLARVRRHLRFVFELPRVNLATGDYSADATAHDYHHQPDKP